MIEFKIPEVGENIEKGRIVSISVSPGDTVKKDQDLMELETDKATVPVPSPADGTIKEILVKEGDEVSIGQTVLKMEEGSGEETAEKETASKQEDTPKQKAPAEKDSQEVAEEQQPPPEETGSSTDGGETIEFQVPEVGENIEKGTVVSLKVKAGDSVKKDQDLLELETDKATIPVPSPADGSIKEIKISEGDEVNIGQVILVMETSGGGSTKAPAPEKKEPVQQEESQADGKKETISQPAVKSEPKSVFRKITDSIFNSGGKDVPAAPSVRRFAREIGIDITQVPGTGAGGRISTDDVKAFAKQLNLSRGSSAGSGAEQKNLPDFSKWGEIDRQKMSQIRSVTADHLSYCWSTIPHVTQFGQADVTDLEKLRKKYSNPERKLTITPFLLKVIASALKVFPQFNSSIDINTKEVIYKKYCHVGVAVDTENGLLVPVIRDVDEKNIFELHDELNEIAERARNKKVTLDELRGGCMTITNLGGIGGTNFTPIVNWPEVAILGVSRASWQPVYENNHFVPKFILPLSVSYDHRIIDGADGARFLKWVCEAIEQPFMMEMEG